MRKIHVGIAYEGSADIDALKILVQRILNSHDLDFDPDAVYPQTPGTGIIGFIKVYAKKFADSQVVLPIYCTDQDKDKKSRRDIIIAKLSEHSPLAAEMSVVGVSIPHFEAWLIADEDVVKSILGLDGDAALPLSARQPKDRLTSLYQHYYEGEVSFTDIRCLLANGMDIDRVARNVSDFRNFVEDIKRVANRIKSAK